MVPLGSSSVPCSASEGTSIPGGLGWAEDPPHCRLRTARRRPHPASGSHLMSPTLSLQLQGAVLVASCVQMLVGFSGLIGFLMRFIGPLTIAPTISLMALPLFDSAGDNAGIHWGIAAT